MEIQEIKQRLSIETVLNHYGLQSDRNGMLKCPFHCDDTASLKIYPKTNTFNCFGCGRNGDQIEFCALKEGSKRKGLLKATELAGAPSLPSTGRKEPGSSPKRPEGKESHIEILTKIFTYFKNGLHSGTARRPTEYLSARGLSPLEGDGKGGLEVGYNSGQFHHRGKLNEKDLQFCIAAGLLIPYKGNVPNGEGTTYTAFAKDCIIFPLKNQQNQIVSLYGRSITNHSKSKHYYLRDRQGLYPGYPIPEATSLILTEAIIDAATLFQLIIRNEQLSNYHVLSCYGTNGLTEEHKAAIKELQHLEEIIFFFDGDKSGSAAIKKYQTELSELKPGITLSKVDTPEGEDINSLFVKYDKDALLQLIRERVFLLVEKTTGKPEPPQGKARLHTTNPDFITYTTDELQIIILGGINLHQLDRLRITVKISRTDTNDPLHSIRHTIDLYHSDSLEKFINKAGEQLETGTNTIRRAIAEMTEQIESYRLSKIESLKEKKPGQRQLSESRYKRAINYLQSPNLMERTNRDIGRTGMIGEENNRLLMYLVFTSRLREQPLHINQ